MIKHTPGPWKVCPSVDHDFLGIYPDTGMREFPIAKMPEISRSDVNAANAALIAAAPDLFDVVQAILRFGELASVSIPTLGGPGGKKNPSKEVWQFPRHMLTELEAAVSKAMHLNPGVGARS